MEEDSLNEMPSTPEPLKHFDVQATDPIPDSWNGWICKNLPMFSSFRSFDLKQPFLLLFGSFMVIFSIMGLAIYKDVLQNLFGEAISVTMELLGYTKDKVLWLSGKIRDKIVFCSIMELLRYTKDKILCLSGKIRDNFSNLSNPIYINIDVIKYIIVDGLFRCYSWYQNEFRHWLENQELKYLVVFTIYLAVHGIGIFLAICYTASALVFVICWLTAFQLFINCMKFRLLWKKQVIMQGRI